jgi:hypothetical protein
MQGIQYTAVMAPYKKIYTLGVDGFEEELQQLAGLAAHSLSPAQQASVLQIERECEFRTGYLHQSQSLVPVSCCSIMQSMISTSKAMSVLDCLVGCMSAQQLMDGWPINMVYTLDITCNVSIYCCCACSAVGGKSRVWYTMKDGGIMTRQEQQQPRALASLPP